MRRALGAAWLCGCTGTLSGQPPGGDAPAGDAAVLADAPAARAWFAYVSGNSTTIQWLSVGSGVLTPAGSVTSFAANPTFLAVDPSATHLYALSESTNRVAAYAIDPATAALSYLNDVAVSSGPAHITVDHGGNYVLVADYGAGKVDVLPIDAATGRVGSVAQTLAPGIRAHEVVLDATNHYAFVPCLGSDKVAQYVFDAATGAMTANATPALSTATGAGPRHLAFAPDGVHAYLVNETNSTLQALVLDPATGRLSSQQTVSTRASGATGSNTGAEVQVHPNGKFVYASNRGDDNIATFAIAADGKVAIVSHTAVGGQTPRSFTLDTDGTHMYVAAQGSSIVAPFAIDPAVGTPAALGASVTATMPTFVGLVGLPR